MCSSDLGGIADLLDGVCVYVLQVVMGRLGLVERRRFLQGSGQLGQRLSGGGV